MGKAYSWWQRNLSTVGTPAFPIITIYHQPSSHDEEILGSGWWWTVERQRNNRLSLTLTCGCQVIPLHGEDDVVREWLIHMMMRSMVAGRHKKGLTDRPAVESSSIRPSHLAVSIHRIVDRPREDSQLDVRTFMCRPPVVGSCTRRWWQWKDEPTGRRR